MRKFLRAAAVTATALLTAGVATLFGLGGAHADAADAPPSIVEDHGYPGAAAIEQQYGLTLLKGDGNIMFTGLCPQDATGLLVVESSITAGIDDKFCFQVKSATTGYLTLQVPETYLVHGDGSHEIKATTKTDDGRVQERNVDPNYFTSVVLGSDTEDIGALVELNVGWDPSLPRP